MNHVFLYMAQLLIMLSTPFTDGSDLDELDISRRNKVLQGVVRTFIYYERDSENSNKSLGRSTYRLCIILVLLFE